MTSRWLPWAGIGALLLLALVYLFLPTHGADLPVTPDDPSAEQEAERAAAEVGEVETSAVTSEDEAEAARTEVELPTNEAEDKAPWEELVIHGRVDAVGLLTDEMLVRLVLLDVPRDQVEEFDGLDILSWIDQDWVRQSKPRAIEADGSFVLRGTPPRRASFSERRYVVSIGIDTGGVGFPMAEGQTVLPVAISPALVGHEHPAENPLVLQAAAPHRVRLNPNIAPEMMWAIHSITVNVNLERIEDSGVEDEEDSFVLSEWLEIPPVPVGGIAWEAWVSRVAPPLELDSVFIDDWMHWEVEVPQPIPVNADIELDVTCDPVGHLIARLPVAIKPESVPYQRWAADLEEDIQYRVSSVDDTNFGTGWTSAYSWELLFDDVAELDLRDPIDRARVSGLHFSYEPDQSWIQLGWFEPGEWQVEVLTPDGTRWTSDPVTVTVGSAQVIDMRAEQALPELLIRMPARYRGLAPQDAHFLNGAGERLSLTVPTPEQEQIGGDELDWQVRVPKEARSLEAWAYDPQADLLQVFFVDFPPGDLPAEVTLNMRNSEGEIRPPAPFAPYVGLVIYPLAEDDSVAFTRSFVMFLEEEEGVASLTVRGLLPGRYQANGIVGAIEEGEFSAVEFEVR